LGLHLDYGEWVTGHRGRFGHCPGSITEGNIIALVTLISFTPQNRKGKIVHLDQLTPYQGARRRGLKEGAVGN
jgi:hypothetical protein